MSAERAPVGLLHTLASSGGHRPRANVAGGHALHYYRGDVGNGANSSASDIDVFVYRLDSLETFIPYVTENLDEVASAGYAVEPAVHSKYAPIINARVSGGQLPNGVSVIVQYIASREGAIEAIVSNFDLSICQVYLETHANAHGVITVYPRMVESVRDDIDKMHGYAFRDMGVNALTRGRAAKYNRRGFRIIQGPVKDAPPPFFPLNRDDDFAKAWILYTTAMAEFLEHEHLSAITTDVHKRRKPRLSDFITCRLSFHEFYVDYLVLCKDQLPSAAAVNPVGFWGRALPTATVWWRRRAPPVPSL